ncbi:hypothetical protein ACSMFN_15520 [Enterobacter sichuanensis]|uniref:hypothetical protein n=1 Tax=Enterobacter sichuanensis TaxID=2071710 RepID=UPI003F1E3FAF
MAQQPGIDNLAYGMNLGKPLSIEGKADLTVTNEVKLSIDDSKFSDAIKAEVQEQGRRNTYLILGVTQEIIVPSKMTQQIGPHERGPLNSACYCFCCCK